MNPFKIKPSSIALISQGGIHKTVTKDDPFFFYKRLDHLYDVLCPGCFVEEELRRRGHLEMVRVEKDFPYSLADRASSRFSGYFTGDAFLGEIFFQALNLSGLAAPLDTFESNEKRQLCNPPNESK